MTEERCWCGHLKRWHHLYNLCLWCVKIGQRHPQWNSTPHHTFALEMPIYMQQSAVDALEALFDGDHETEGV
jgi:hypothetical protein